MLAISRADGSVVAPTAGERLREGDVIALSGTREAIKSAVELLGAQPLVGDEVGSEARA